MPRESGASSSHVSWPGLSRPSCLGMHGACISEITGTRRKRAGPVMTEEILRLRDMPGAVEEAVAGDVARLLVVLPGVERLALVCDLLGAVVARDDGAKQVAYKGKPLYTWKNDKKPGDITGDGFLNGAGPVISLMQAPC